MGRDGEGVKAGTCMPVPLAQVKKKLRSSEEGDEKVGRPCHGWRLQEQWQPQWGRRKSQGGREV